MHGPLNLQFECTVFYGNSHDKKPDSLSSEDIGGHNPSEVTFPLIRDCKSNGIECVHCPWDAFLSEHPVLTPVPHSFKFKLIFKCVIIDDIKWTVNMSCRETGQIETSWSANNVGRRNLLQGFPSTCMLVSIVQLSTAFHLLTQAGLTRCCLDHLLTKVAKHKQHEAACVCVCLLTEILCPHGF